MRGTDHTRCPDAETRTMKALVLEACAPTTCTSLLYIDTSTAQNNLTRRSSATKRVRTPYSLGQLNTNAQRLFSDNKPDRKRKETIHLSSLL